MFIKLLFPSSTGRIDYPRYRATAFQLPFACIYNKNNGDHSSLQMETNIDLVIWNWNNTFRWSHARYDHIVYSSSSIHSQEYEGSRVYWVTCKQRLACTSEGDVPVIALLGVDVAVRLLVLRCAITTCTDRGIFAGDERADAWGEWNVDLVAIVMRIGARGMADFLEERVRVGAWYTHEERRRGLTVPPVMTRAHPDAALSAFMHVTVLSLIWSSDVHEPCWRLVQPPDDDVVMPDAASWAAATDCDSLAAITRERVRENVWLEEQVDRVDADLHREQRRETQRRGSTCRSLLSLEVIELSVGAIDGG